MPIRSFLPLLLILFLSGCHSDQPGANTTVPHDIGIWPTPQNPLAGNKDLAYTDQINAILSRLTLEQKVGQMVQPQLDAITPDEVRDYSIGSVLNGGNAYANNDKYASVSDWVNVVDAYYRASMDDSNGRTPIPITWGTDAVHGQNKVIGATIFPHNVGLGAAHDPELMRKIGKITAVEMLVTGVDWTFAPSVAVVRDDRWGRTYESFSEDPEMVELLTRPYIEGLQGVAGTSSFMNDDHVMATAKHFIGDGGTADGVDRGDNLASEEELYRIHGMGYVAAIEAGVLTIMVSHSMWHGVRMHGSKYLLTDVLKQKMGFDGFLVGDWNSHALVKGCSEDSCPQAINAGLDMVMVTRDWKDFIKNTVQQVRDGVIPESRIDDAVTRILRAKFRAGLFAKGPPSKRKYADKLQYFGSPEHRKVARQAVRESLVLLKNNNSLLPLSPRLNVLVAGDGADNIGKQAGGWTISWRGAGAKNTDFPNGESILSGIKNTLEKAGGTVIYNERGKYTKKPDVAIVTFGEDPYAEWFGDIKHLSYQNFTNRDARLLEKLKGDGIPVIALFISGRPLWVNRAINASDAFVAVWLPGTEGGGIADVLFRKPDGSINYDFTGKLAFSWPMYPSQTSLNRGDGNYHPLFPYGYGLTYQDKKQLATLELREDIPKSAKDPTLKLFEGRAIVPWFAGLADQDGFSVYLGGEVARQYLKVRETDRSTQGDAMELEWLGGGDGTFILVNIDENQDYSYYLDEKSAITMAVKLEQKATGPLLMRMGRYDDLDKSIDISAGINTLPVDQWQAFSVDLACFAGKGVDFRHISSPFALLSRDALKLQLADIRILPGLGGKATLSCTP